MKTELRKSIEIALKDYISEYLYWANWREVRAIAANKASLKWANGIDGFNEVMDSVLRDISNHVGPYWKWAEKKAREMALILIGCKQ